MVTRSRRNLARNEAPPKAVVERNKTKDVKRPTTLYLMYFFLALLVISGKPSCGDAKAHEGVEEIILALQVLESMRGVTLQLFRMGNPLNPMIRAHIRSVQRSSFSTNLHNKGSGSRDDEAKDHASNARMSQRLWDTLVPERNWSLLSPQFWVLLVATISLYTYNRVNNKHLDKTKALLDLERDRHKEIVNNK
ncbi:conserved hypothetical protein [Theileria orientalis strain Shintoku]|uniref:Uncharacterized protein n=1 Tax=Theileria orientalis strain Shintoku TaxID=869250 RepID=J4C3T5_THEOR|nr:conserved hypothetical protein [Theileria orientalis strain Shintoku]BAM41001.1 conserved hypothetical protein [Theileria orientalis strain Shintoku]|eukprot:XP_009691302.1 conserved hypothetical protein [Theileria orientalis strain Shintoku]